MRLSYVGMLAFVLVGTLPLELFLGTKVYRRWRRLSRSVAPVLACFACWDLYAIAAGHWRFDPRQITGIVLPGGLPLEELLFFLVVPIASILTLEAVRRVRGWPVGDEPGGADADQAAGESHAGRSEPA